MQQSNFDIGQQMMAEATPGAHAAFSRYLMSEKRFNEALQQQRGFDDQQADMARGGLMTLGMARDKDREGGGGRKADLKGGPPCALPDALAPRRAARAARLRPARIPSPLAAAQRVCPLRTSGQKGFRV
jgi:hypothetical protein